MANRISVLEGARETMRCAGPLSVTVRLRPSVRVNAPPAEAFCGGGAGVSVIVTVRTNFAVVVGARVGAIVAAAGADAGMIGAVVGPAAGEHAASSAATASKIHSV